ncbi:MULTISPECIES: lyase family protein [unclassified Mycolicibacterium]|uniref:lyase family protein n=1 Tax=unclassified Mycolicibacterium TaxID=2636767 RepID=UPI0012DCE62A|nr:MULTISPECIES: lyase family protein [unclassified Mycolicibacterium]MUL83009.1 3-carboxy-cis,cis-muconate cycloisomerase [Mycolicibacterium sp. CBMA 329]MUL89344.1 3-carboxy-cis,cis-muconate cycloisomerase [Mycolicibacterium sp. CBMA 331]MUL99033.1 3-carboxy-cis,cis-muconate cycloisomerase [Mycolicibacterium sp. CBMA 334]MUM25669.1 3-carboxy-cis,cis-muconate cycloisomerase [Mycolicibacterium sp. CBMA 295]MUM38860.1 3-carboxy-cis,cis-muconate cycloisomerase [Mycolicibacterium sp. CBMA 247]
MSSLLWPGDHRADDLFSDAAVLDAMMHVEVAWSEAMVSAGIAPAEAAVTFEQLQSALSRADLDAIAVDAESGGNPVIPLIARLRPRLGTGAGQWLHRGLTSQDVVDTALMLEASRAFRRITGLLTQHIERLAILAERHRVTAQVARTLTQQAVPSSFGLKVAHWLDGVLAAHEQVMTLRFPVQLGGAAGTLSGAVELAGALHDPVLAVERAVGSTASALGLAEESPWHVVRAPVTRHAEAAAACTAAWGHIANDVLTMSRSEIGEVAEGTGGGSSTMPHKSNPTLSVLIRRAALTSPTAVATLQLASADAADERTAGAWHAEWATFATLLRRTVVAASQTADLLDGLTVSEAAMARNLSAAGDSVLSEHRSMAELAQRPAVTDPRGAAELLIDRTLQRARAVLGDEQLRSSLDDARGPQ